MKKGELIAWSGNTGGSTAPHLHFEIRNTQTERPLNPQLFGLPITDTRPPVVKQLYLYDLTRSLYGQTPRNVALRKAGDAYVPAGGDTLPAVSGFAGIGLVTDDYADGSDNTLAPYTLSWDADGTPAGTITLDDIGYDETRYLHAYADYPTKWKGGPWVQCLFRLPGNCACPHLPVSRLAPGLFGCLKQVRRRLYRSSSAMRPATSRSSASG